MVCPGGFARAGGAVSNGGRGCCRAVRHLSRGFGASLAGRRFSDGRVTASGECGLAVRSARNGQPRVSDHPRTAQEKTAFAFCFFGLAGTWTGGRSRVHGVATVAPIATIGDGAGGARVARWARAESNDGYFCPACERAPLRDSDSDSARLQRAQPEASTENIH